MNFCLTLYLRSKCMYTPGRPRLQSGRMALAAGFFQLRRALTLGRCRIYTEERKISKDKGSGLGFLANLSVLLRCDSVVIKPQTSRGYYRASHRGSDFWAAFFRAYSYFRATSDRPSDKFKALRTCDLIQLPLSSESGREQKPSFFHFAGDETDAQRGLD